MPVNNIARARRQDGYLSIKLFKSGLGLFDETFINVNNSIMSRRRVLSFLPDRYSNFPQVIDGDGKRDQHRHIGFRLDNSCNAKNENPNVDMEMKYVMAGHNTSG